MQGYGSGLQKCSDILGKELSLQNSFDTTSIALQNMKAGLDKLANQASQKASIIMAEIMEPFDSFVK
jgi:hypothetical protein